MSKLKILVTGANGQLGKELQAISGLYPELEFIFLTKEELPIQNEQVVSKYFENIKPDYCVNCATYTAVDRAETEKELAFLVNGESTGILSAACYSFKTGFIHISTDYVFNGNGIQPYEEDDAVDPVNAYGASKLLGEQLAISKNNQALIIRTSWVYSSFGNNFVKTMMRLMKERTHLGIVNDQKGSPTYAADLAQLIVDIIKAGDWKAGIYHYSNEGIITWYQFAQLIKEYTESSCDIKPIKTSDFPTPARRPAFSAMNKNKIKSIYKISIPKWEDSLKRCIKRINEL